MQPGECLIRNSHNAPAAITGRLSPRGCPPSFMARTRSRFIARISFLPGRARWLRYDRGRTKQHIVSNSCAIRGRCKPLAVPKIPTLFPVPARQSVRRELLSF